MRREDTSLFEETKVHYIAHLMKWHLLLKDTDLDAEATLKGREHRSHVNHFENIIHNSLIHTTGK